MTSAHGDDPINVSLCVSGVRNRDLGVGCDSSSGERMGGTSIGVGRLSSSSEDGRET